MSILKVNCQNIGSLYSKWLTTRLLSPVYILLITIDQSTLQYYMIQAWQAFHSNYYQPLVEENKSLKTDIDNLKSIIMEIKHKNDKRFEYLTSKNR